MQERRGCRRSSPRRQLCEELEVFRQIRGGVLERRQDENPLFFADGLFGRLDGVKVNVFNRARIDLYRGVVVEDDWCLEVSIPSIVIVRRHFHGWLGRTPAVEAMRRQQLSVTA
jgi:hypothetical protein